MWLKYVLHYLEGGEYVEEGEYMENSCRFNFSCVLRGEVKYLEQIKEYIAKEYIQKGLVKLIKPTYDKKEIYILTDEQWKEYQTLKERDENLIAGFS